MKAENRICSSRRHFLGNSAFGLGSLGLTWLLDRERLLAAPAAPELRPTTFDALPKSTHHKPQATAMISLFMSGGPSQIDLFDPKPLLADHDGKLYPGDDIVYDNAGGASKVIMASPFKFQRCGQSGMELSELVPHMQGIADDITLIRSMNLVDIRNHLGGMKAFDTGRSQGAAGRPSLGAWLLYGLGAETQTLPAFVAISMVPSLVGGSYWSSGFLPSVYEGTLLRNEAPRILNLDPPPHLAGEPQRRNLDTLRGLNALHLDRHPGEGDLTARIASYELASRMQLAATEALEISSETRETQELYGVDAGEARQRQFAEACLVARRLVERGVRFVQIWDNGWDHHERIDSLLPESCRRVDRASAALVCDLKRRGLLDTTLVHWGGEMGRLPVVQGRGAGKHPGRDHNTFGFSMWLAGGGVKGGHIHGATDDFGLRAVGDVVHHYDYHATLLHLFGLDATNLSFKSGLRNETLLDGQPGRIIEGILA